ncbi:aminotransferase class V-fold PLP-dependent enzyme [Sphingosinicella terrae]|uniref:aminotransferase class V-fold PLP-dependent enzyme n=1 Tax=Sphingosinicella terrae TaxID=2172047 RepID=UPI000E0DE6F4|nr:aminotransferase class V-fold PLP-dependent enzyme [Sphingosinicella terrae]
MNAPAGSDRSLFDIPEDLAYFNCASIGPMPRSAQAEIAAAAERRGRPWTISNVEWMDEVEERRGLFAAVAGTDPEAIALIPSASYGLAVAARNLQAAPGQHILVLADDFPSDVYTWRSFAARKGCEILTVDRPEQGGWTQAILDRLDERVAIVAVPNVHWTDGAFIDLARVGARAREIGAALAVDASQSFGILPVDWDAVRPDFLVTVGYKWLLGPYALGYLYVDEAHRGGEPLEENWLLREGSEDFARLVDYVDAYRPGARRYDVGQRSAFELTRAASASLRLMLGWQAKDLAGRLGAITGRIEAEARRLGLRIGSGPERAPHLIGLELPAGAMEKAAALFRDANVHISFRGRAVRIAPHVYTSESDVERLLGVLARVAEAAG